jgi:hypothetical protein
VAKTALGVCTSLTPLVGRTSGMGAEILPSLKTLFA